MWLMTTKNRPKAAEQTLQACWDTGMRQPGIVYVDGPDHKQYDNIKLPDNWEMVKWVDVGGIGNLAGSKQYVFENYPDERVYGWVSDDNIPITPEWSYIIEDRADPWFLVHCRDMWLSENDDTRKPLEETRNLGGGICWGGDLVRCVGWWAPPGIIQGSIDWTWTSMVGDTPLGVYLHDVIVRHDNWRTGKREKDDNDNVKKPHVLKDIAYISVFRQSKEFATIKERVYRGHLNWKAKTTQ